MKTHKMKDKNKIIVYADWRENFKDLTDDELGKLMRHFFDYVNDLNPVLEDRILQIAWSPIESTLKRDLNAWKAKSLKNSESAKIRWNKKNANASKRIKRNANYADSDSDSVKDNDSVDDILLEKETKGLFNDWINYRKEIKKPIKSLKTKIALAKKMKTEGFEKSKLVINLSIVNGWQGLFWDNATEVKPKEKPFKSKLEEKYKS